MSDLKKAEGLASPGSAGQEPPFKLPDELLGGAVKVIHPTDLRNRVGRYMLEQHGLHIGQKVDAGKVQDMIEDFVSKEIQRSSPSENTGQEPVSTLTYEQEVHALLCAAAANTEGLLRYFEAQASSEAGEARKLTQKCIDWKRDDLKRIRALIPQALQKRAAAVLPSVESSQQTREEGADNGR